MRSRRLYWIASFTIGCGAIETHKSPIAEFEVSERPVLDENRDPVPAFKLVGPDLGHVVTEAATVTVRVVSSVPAKVHDAQDGAIVSATNSEFDVMLSDDPVSLFVRADGYEDLQIRVIPNTDKVVEVELDASSMYEAEPAHKEGLPDGPSQKMDLIGDDLEDVLDALGDKKR